MNLAWDASGGGAIAGYRVYYGPTSHSYTNMVAAGIATNKTVTGLASGVTYVFAMTAYDTAGLESDFSSELFYTVPFTNGAPLIALTSPANGASYTAPATITLAASVTVNGHTITKVQFYNGATLLGEDTTSPYNFTWSGVSAGNYSVSARAVYDAGSTVNSSAANVAVTALAGSGTVAFTNPASITIADAGAGAPYPSTINVSAMGGAINQLAVTLQGLSHTWPADVDVLLVGPGGQKVMIFSDVGAGSGVNNATVTLADGAATALPAAAQIVSGMFRPTDLEIGDVLPAPAPAGPYATALSSFNGLSANGTWSLYVNDDGAGDQGTIGGGWSLSITTTGAVVNPPTVVLTSPAAGTSYLAPATLNLAASVTANGHTITKVQFYDGAILLGEDTAAPYVWTASNVSAGSFSLTARAMYDAGSTVDSAPVNVAVTNPAPTVALTAPFNGASYAAPAAINLAASVTANSHTITKVQFYAGGSLLGETVSAPYSFTWSNVSPGKYSLTARAVYDAGSTVDSSPASISVTGLPAPWQAVDIGSVGAVGYAIVSNGLFTVQGAGNLSGLADNFRFVYQPLSGDGEIRVRLNSVENTGANGRIGVMIRESLTSGSEYAFMGLSPDGTFRWQRRSNTGGSTATTTSTVGLPPNAWARLVRTGNTITSYKSIDGTNWTKVDSRNMSMAANLYFGLAVASGSSNTLNRSTFTTGNVIP